jgi:RND family efflux transporter MFP subunit
MSRRGVGAALVVAFAAAACGPADGTEWVTARRGELVVGVEVSGQLASVESHPLGPPAIHNVWNFKIAFMAGEGDAVEKGTPVLGLDDSELRRQLEEYANEADSAAKQLTAYRASARMALVEAKLAVEQALAAQRKAKLKTQGVADIVSRNALARARLDYEFAQYSVDVARRKQDARRRQDRAELDRLERVKARAEQRVEEIQQAMAKMRVPAPIDGTVLYVKDWQGNKKKMGDSCWRAERIVEVVSLDHMKAEGQIDEMDASRVAVGQAVRLRLDANPDVELIGKVEDIEDSVQRRSPEDPLKVVELEIELEPSDEVELRPGMRFRGTVETDRVEDVLIVPLEAITATADGAIVYRRDGGDAVATPVTLGRRGTDSVEVVAGLEAGDRIALMDKGRDLREGAQ